MLRQLLRISIAAGAVGLAGCMHHPNMTYGPRAGGMMDGGGTMSSPRPGVATASVGANGGLVVNQEPLVILRKPQATAFARFNVGSGLTFAESDGIVFTEQTKAFVGGVLTRLKTPVPVNREQFNCQTQPGNTEVVCVIRGDVADGVYAYTINAVRDGKPLILDPTGIIESKNY